jgi:hypothetical protein
MAPEEHEKDSCRLIAILSLIALLLVSPGAYEAVRTTAPRAPTPMTHEAHDIKIVLQPEAPPSFMKLAKDAKERHSQIFEVARSLAAASAILGWCESEKQRSSRRLPYGQQHKSLQNGRMAFTPRSEHPRA